MESVDDSKLTKSVTGKVYLVLYILKAKSNFTLFSSEYINTRSDLKQMAFCRYFQHLPKHNS